MGSYGPRRSRHWPASSGSFTPATSGDRKCWKRYAALRRSTRFADVHRNKRIRMLATVAPRLLTPAILDEANDGPTHWATAELLRLKSENTGDAATAERLLRRSMDIADAQGARSWRLRTAMSMARRHLETGGLPDAAAILSTVYDSFSEGRDTPDLRDAAALLDRL